MHAVRMNAAEAAVTVTSSTKPVTDWCARYVQPWWDAAEVPAETTRTSPLLEAEVSPEQYEELAADVMAAPHTSTLYARAHTLVARDVAGGVISAISPDEKLAYRSEPATGRLTIYGHETEPVATAAARLAREAMRGVLLRAGWSVLHASAVTFDNRVVLALGDKGDGKTSTALTLATRCGGQLLANDRVFVRREPSGGVWVLPWPSAAAIGLGLLDALGWLDVARKRLESGEALHPTQHQAVTDALLAGSRTSLWDGRRELKAQVFPDQFPDWFGVPLSTGGRAAHLLFPKVVADATPSLAEAERSLAGTDFMRGRTEDRYPDIFGLAGGIDGGGQPAERDEVTARLAQLPAHSAILGHDLDANGARLARALDL